jgi:hypothetical protein
VKNGDYYHCLYNHDWRCKTGMSGLWAVTLEEMKRKGYVQNEDSESYTDSDSHTDTEGTESSVHMKPGPERRFRRNEAPNKYLYARPTKGIYIVSEIVRPVKRYPCRE